MRGLTRTQARLVAVIAAGIAFVVLLFCVAFLELLLDAPVARSAYPILAKNLPALVPHQPLTMS